MNRLWLHIRIPLALVFLLIAALALARLFSGPEDTWIKDGNPAVHAPSWNYREETFDLFN